MFYNTVPNQKTVCVHREHPTSAFLGIKNENWQTAAKDLGPYALELYLYFASNANGYRLAFSPKAVNEAIGMSQSTARDQFKKLVSKGYLVQINGNGYEFFETSQTRVAPIQQQIAAADSNDATAHNFEERASVVKLESGNREIYNKYEKNIINKSVDKNLGVNPVDKKEFKF